MVFSEFMAKIIMFSLFVFFGNAFCSVIGEGSVFPSDLKIERKADAKPLNLVFILTDDHRFDTMGFMGHPFIETPNMDRMAKSGAHLKNAFVTTSLCSPSRASILTGVYTSRHTVFDNYRQEPLDIVYFPQYLQKAGYKTGFFGKWHMGAHHARPRPGFDRWVSFRGQGDYLPEQGEGLLNIDGVTVPQKGYITDELTDYAIEWLKEQKPKERPFFLYLSHKAVHSNFTPASRHLGRYDRAEWEQPGREMLDRGLTRKRPRWVQDQRNSWHGVDFPYHSDLKVEEYYKRYCETLLAVDESIGRIMNELEQMGILEDTLVIYMGDNGFMFGEHGLIDKRVAYDTSIRVPAIMQCPSLFKGGQVIDNITANIDIAPTFLDAAGLLPPKHMDGMSLLPLVKGEINSSRDYFLYVYYWEKGFPHTPTQFALRSDRYKLIHYYGLWDTDELFDLHLDPNETRNLIDDPKLNNIREEMEVKLYNMLDDTGGLTITVNRPPPYHRNNRFSAREGYESANFPSHMVIDKPVERQKN